MPSAEYFWRQAETCAALAQVTDDEGLASTLRLMAADFLAKAEEGGGELQPHWGDGWVPKGEDRE